MSHVPTNGTLRSQLQLPKELITLNPCKREKPLIAVRPLVIYLFNKNLHDPATNRPAAAFVIPKHSVSKCLQSCCSCKADLPKRNIEHFENLCFKIPTITEKGHQPTFQETHSSLIYDSPLGSPAAAQTHKLLLRHRTNERTNGTLTQFLITAKPRKTGNLRTNPWHCCCCCSSGRSITMATLLLTGLCVVSGDRWDSWLIEKLPPHKLLKF